MWCCIFLSFVLGKTYTNVTKFPLSPSKCIFKGCTSANSKPGRCCKQNCSVLTWNVHFAHLQGGFVPLRLLVQMVSVDPPWWDVGKMPLRLFFLSYFSPSLHTWFHVVIFLKRIYLMWVLLTLCNCSHDLQNKLKIWLSLFYLGFSGMLYKHQQQALQLLLFHCLELTELLQLLYLLR